MRPEEKEVVVVNGSNAHPAGAASEARLSPTLSELIDQVAAKRASPVPRPVLIGVIVTVSSDGVLNTSKKEVDRNAQR